MKRTSLHIVAIFSFLYIGFWAAVAYRRWDEFLSMSFNELGDFLAGTIGVLVFVWLVLGYFLQARELNASVKALRLQATELKNSVDQQKSLVTITQKQLSLDELAQKSNESIIVQSQMPHIVVKSDGVSSSGRGGKAYRFAVHNVGETSVSMTITCEPLASQFAPKHFDLLESENPEFFSINFNESTKLKDFPANAEFHIESQNKIGWIKRQSFSIGNFRPKLLNTDIVTDIDKDE